MFPWSHDFIWDAGHIVFLGCFWAAVLLIVGTVALAAVRATRQAGTAHGEATLWRAEFEELPATARRCRHELTGEVRSRTCPNAFDCRACEQHAAFVARRVPEAPAPAGEVAGLRVPLDRLYHRGHAWARQEADGTVTVGLDDLGARLLGTPDALDLPAPGTELVANGPAFRARKGSTEVRILSPVDGTVVETGAPVAGWLLRVKPPAEGLDARHLLSGTEARTWLLREWERLQRSLAIGGIGPALADGGTPLEDLSSVVPCEKRDAVYGAMFLEG